MDIEKIKQSPYYIGELSMKALKALPRCKTGDIAYVTDVEKVFIYKDKKNKWMPIEEKIIDTGMSLMELNRQAISKLPCYKANDMSYESMLKIDNFCVNNEFYMLYGKEIGYFTVFQILSNRDSISDAVIDCLSNIGKIYSIDLTEDKTAIEIWVQTKEGKKTTYLYLFPYDNGIVKVG